MTLRDEPLAFTRLDDVREAGDHCAATLTELDAQGKPVRVRELAWPPEGKVRVVRAP